MKIEKDRVSERAKQLHALVCEELGLDPAEVTNVTVERTGNPSDEEWFVHVEMTKILSEETVRGIFEKWR